MDYNGDYLQARNKINQATQWTGTTTISLGSGTHDFGYRLLHESETTEIQNTLPLDELSDYEEGENTDAHERMMELQRKEGELTDEEEEELRELTDEVDTGDLEEKFGEEGFAALRDAGEKAIKPTQADVSDIINADPNVQQQVLGTMEFTRNEAEDLLREDMKETISNQPFPIKMNIGLEAFFETISVLGNGLQQSE